MNGTVTRLAGVPAVLLHVTTATLALLKGNKDIFTIHDYIDNNYDSEYDIRV